MISLINKVTHFFKERRNRKAIRKATLIRVTAEYEDLINEYRLVLEKKSKLSRTKRDFVVLRIRDLILRGHIQVNK